MTIKTVTADKVSGFNMSIMQLFGSGPKLTIKCGECHINFQKRVPVIDEPAVSCEYCNTINILPIIVET